MDFAINPQYSDIFSGSTPDFDSLLSDIPSHLVISTLAFINDKLYFYKNDPKIQREIFNLLLRRQSLATKNNISNRLTLLESKGSEKVVIFTATTNMEFLHRELTNFRDLLMPEETTPEQELNIFKAYLIIIGEKSSVYSNSQTKDTIDSIDYFYKNTWPILVDQYTNEENVDIVVGLIKSIALFNHLQYDSKYSDAVKAFLSQAGKNTSWNYVLDLMNIITSKVNASGSAFSLDEVRGYEEIFQSFRINVDEYKEFYKGGKKNYAGIKDKPLYKFGEGRYLVLDWNSFITKLHEGLKYDLYKGIKKHDPEKVKDFPDFLNHIGQQFTEGNIFKTIVNNIFQDRYNHIQFDDGKIQSHPDAYVRNNKNIFVFEIKDVLFPSSAIDSCNYAQVKKVLDDKYNNHKKGVAQIIKSIEQLKVKPFDSDSYDKIGIKQRNVVIYPIMIYTDRIFGMPGISHYLNKSFKEQIESNRLINSFQRIQPLSFISIEYFINNFHYLHKGYKLFKEIIDDYAKTLNNRNERFRKKDTLPNLFSLMEDFERMKNVRFKPEKRHPDFVKHIVESLSLTEGLTKDINIGVWENQ